MRIAIEAKNLTKVYHRGSEEIPAVNDVSLRINKGDFISIIGPSGSGKTTLVNLLGCLDNPTSGELFLEGRSDLQRRQTSFGTGSDKDQEGDLRIYLPEFLPHPHPDGHGKRAASAHLLPQGRLGG